MIKNNILSLLGVAILIVSSGCTDDAPANEDSIESTKKEMRFSFSLPSVTKATETSFEQGDRVGLFVTDVAAPLEIAGNIVNNEPFINTGNAWVSSRKLYWNDGLHNVYAYYPYSQEVSSVSDYPFSVSTDQREKGSASEPKGFEASDFLFASAKEIRASSNPVNMTFRHIMSKLTIRLIKGEDFEGDIPENATVYIHNTVPSATIDLNVGIATKAMRGTAETVIARQSSKTSYSAILVPQRIDNSVPLIEVVMSGVSYLYESRFIFKPGVHHLVSLVVDKNPDQVKIEIGGEITGWN